MLLLGLACIREPPKADTAGETAAGVGETGDSSPVIDSGSDTGDTSLPDTGDTDSGAPDTADTTDTGDTADLPYVKMRGREWSAGCASHECINMDHGDVDGDGVEELVAGFAEDGDPGVANGRIYTISPPVESVLDLAEAADVRIDGPADGNLGEGDVSAPDLDGDGVADLLVSASYDVRAGEWGRAYVFYGPVVADTTYASAGATMTGYCDCTDHGEPLATSLSSGDLDGDGTPDIVVAGGYDYTGFVLTGPIYGDVDVPTASVARFTSHHAFQTVGDLDGDGLDDVVGSDYYYNPDTTVVLFHGPISGDIGGDSADAWWALDGMLGDASIPKVARDLDGDGNRDLVIGDGSNVDGGLGSGAVFATTGPYSGGYDLRAVAAELWGTERSGTGCAVAVLDDLDGDGRADLVVGASDRPQVDYGPGKAYVVPGPVVGSGPIEDAATHILEYGDGTDLFGDEVAEAGDVDGDGIPDVMIAGPGDDDNGSYAGAVWLVYGKELQ